MTRLIIFARKNNTFNDKERGTKISVKASVTRLGEILLFGYFLLDQILRFELNKQLGVDVLDFQFELGYFGCSIGYISKYWANLFSIFWSLCSKRTNEGRRSKRFSRSEAVFLANPIYPKQIEMLHFIIVFQPQKRGFKNYIFKLISVCFSIVIGNFLLFLWLGMRKDHLEANLIRIRTQLIIFWTLHLNLNVTF